MSSATVWSTVPLSVPNEGNQQKKQSAMPLPQVAPAAANTVWPTITSNNKTSKKQVSRSERIGTSTWNTSGYTSLASDDSRSIDSTQNLTVSSKESQSRFKQLEDMIRRQQEQSNQESQEAQTRLCNMEIQFNRIDDLDTKVAAIQGDLSVVHNQLSTAAQNQHQLSLDLQSLQNHTSSQFAVLSSNGISAMESQHSLSTSMLDLRSQFSQMSRLLQDLSNKLENTMTNGAAELNNPQRSRAEVSTSAAATATEGTDGTEMSVSSRRSAASETTSQTSSYKSHQDSSTVSSTCSTMDETSVADASQCPSPTKKKHRSSPVTEETTAEQEEEENSGGGEVGTARMTRRHSMVSTNLGTRFDSVIEQENTTPRRPPHSPASPDTPNTVDTAQHTQEAPLDPQYTATGPAGADET
jgi:chromosome segregation ATPase